jgi:hypothetical protein
MKRTSTCTNIKHGVFIAVLVVGNTRYKSLQVQTSCTNNTQVQVLVPRITVLSCILDRISISYCTTVLQVLLVIYGRTWFYTGKHTTVFYSSAVFYERTVVTGLSEGVSGFPVPGTSTCTLTSQYLYFYSYKKSVLDTQDVKYYQVPVVL